MFCWAWFLSGQLVGVHAQRCAAGGARLFAQRHLVYQARSRDRLAQQPIDRVTWAFLVTIGIGANCGTSAKAGKSCRDMGYKLKVLPGGTRGPWFRGTNVLKHVPSNIRLSTSAYTNPPHNWRRTDPGNVEPKRIDYITLPTEFVVTLHDSCNRASPS